MQFTQEAAVAVNAFIDKVQSALPLPPSARLAAVDRLYRDIESECEARARKSNQDVIGIDIVREHLATLGTPEDCARRLAEGAAFRFWPGDYFAEAFRHYGVHEKADAFARFAARRGEEVARRSIQAAASALEVASRKLREASEKLRESS